MSQDTTRHVASDRPLAISLLLGVSGWFAGLFLLVFVAMLFHPEDVASAAIVGTVLLAAAWGLFMVAHEGEPVFVAQLGLALSIAGQCLVLYALTAHTSSDAPVAAAALVLQVLLALLMPNRLHRTMSTLFAMIAWALTLHFVLLGENRAWRHDVPSAASSLPAALAGWLATWGPVAATLWWAIRNEAALAARGWAPTAGAIVTGLIAGLAFATLGSQPFESIVWYGHDDAGFLALWPLLSALAALGALVAAFALGRRSLMALCGVAALLHVSHFYYALGTSLLVKSLLMLAMGVVFIVAARALRAREAT
jgi:hypothetical protein